MHPPLGTVIADQYRLDSIVGTGDLSTVYAATNLMTAKQMAIKLLRSDASSDGERSQLLLSEAATASAIDHPNVVNVIDVGRHDGSLFLVMELLHGETLSKLISRGVPDPRRFIGLIMPALRGVHAAHRSGVVHRDLNPDNIFLCRGPNGEAREPKVLDFGISRPAFGRGADNARTRAEADLGAPRYTAPEQLRGLHAVDERCDIYALGVVLYHAFSGAYPYGAGSADALLDRMLEGRATPLRERCPELPVGLADVVMRAVAVDAAERFPSVAALGVALEPYAGGVAFSPAAAGRESATQLRYLRVPAKLPSQRVFAPPRTRRDAQTSPSLRASLPSPLPRATPPVPPPRTASGPLLHSTRSPVTIALQPSDLLGVSEPPRSWRRITPVPPMLGAVQPKLPRLVPDTAQVEKPRATRGLSRRRGALVVGALLAIGSLAALAEGPRKAGNTASSAAQSRTNSAQPASSLTAVKPAFSVGTRLAVDGARATVCPGEGSCDAAIPYGKEPPPLSRRELRALASQQAAERSLGETQAASAAKADNARADGATTPDGAGSATLDRSEAGPAPGEGEPSEPKPVESNPYLRR